MSTAAPVGRKRGGAVAVGAGILLSRLFGLVRQRVIGHYIGVGDAGDVISAAMRIPNILQNMLGEGVLSASFVPVYARLRAEGREADAARLARAVFARLAAICAIVVLAGIALAPMLVSVIVAGFPEAKRADTVTLVRILFPGMGVLVLSAWCLGVLNAHRRYFTSYAAPIAWNVAIIAALAVGASTANSMRAAWLVAVGSVVGSLLQLAVQYPGIREVLPRGANGPAPKELATVRRNFLPVLFGRGIVQISALIDQLIASIVSLVAPGAAAVLFYAQNISLLPVSLFGMSIAVSELTEMAEARPDAVANAVRGRMAPAIRGVAYFIVPCAVAFAALGDVAAATLLETGNFNKTDTIWVWAVLAGSAVGLLAGTLGRIYNSAFYALHDTSTPVRLAAIRIAVSATLGAVGALLAPSWLGLDAKWGVAAITAASGIAAWVEFILLRRALGRKIADLPWPRGAFAKLWGTAVTAAAVGYAVKVVIPAWHPVVRGIAVFAAFGTVYLGATMMLGVEEARNVGARIGGRLGGRGA